MDSQQKKIILIVLKLASSTALLLWVIRKSELSEVIGAIRQANLYLLIGAFVVYGASYYLRTYRWQNLLKTKGIIASNIYLYQSYMVGIFFSNFLPSIVGGDGFRIYDIWRLEPNKSIAVSTVLLDRILGLIVLMAFAGVALLFAPYVANNVNLPYSLDNYLWAIGGIFILAIVVQKTFLPLDKIALILKNIQLPLLQKILEKFNNVFNAFVSFSNHKSSLIKALSWSIAVQITVISHYYLIARALSIPTPFKTFFLVIPVATVITMLPISINGIGLRENAFVFLLGAFSPGVSRADTIAFSWLSYGIIVLLGLVGGILHMQRKYSITKT